MYILTFDTFLFNIKHYFVLSLYRKRYSKFSELVPNSFCFQSNNKLNNMFKSSHKMYNIYDTTLQETRHVTATLFICRVICDSSM